MNTTQNNIKRKPNQQKQKCLGCGTWITLKYAHCNMCRMDAGNSEFNALMRKWGTYENNHNRC